MEEMNEQAIEQVQGAKAPRLAAPLQGGAPSLPGGDGILTQVYKQPSDNSPSVSEDGTHFTEKWKGKYDTLKELPLTTFAPGKARTTPAGAVESYGAPSLYNGYSWVVESATVQEVEAGDHAILTVTYKAWKPSGAGYIDKDEDETWGLSWGSYSLTPYAFCANEAVKDAQAKDYSTDWTSTAWRKNIEDFFGSRKGDKSNWEYVPNNSDTILRLNEAERLVAIKVMNGTGAVYHYPIITHTTVKEKNSTELTSTWSGEEYPGQIGDDIDYKTSLPSDCPYDFPSTGDDAWEFIKVADNIVCEKDPHRIRWIRSTQYWGARKWDDNFYGTSSWSHSSSLETCRWKIGEV